MSTEKINWFWAHRRNSSLHHMSFLMQGLSGKGWQPAVNFYFDNQAVVGVPEKGCYIFYDKDQLNSQNKYQDIQNSINNNPNFVSDFRQRSDELFGALLLNSWKISEENLGLLSDRELYCLYDRFIQCQLKAPIITVQLWGIEACLDESYIIMKYLKKRLEELGKPEKYSEYREILSVNTGETVAFTEQKDFYRLAQALDKPDIKKIFSSSDTAKIKNDLKENYGGLYEAIYKHINKYEWMNTEYVSEEWPEEKWLDLFKQSLFDKMSPEEKKGELIANFKKLNKDKLRVIEELDPPGDVRHAMECLSELIAQRDWAKGYFSKALLFYSELLDKMASRINISKTDVLLYSFKEIKDYFLEGKKVEREELDRRLSEGFVILIKGGEQSLYTGKERIEEVLKSEGLTSPFDEVEEVESIKGLSASRGCAEGKARVVEDASRLSEFAEGDILVTYMTTMEFTPYFRKASAVVTDEGGMSCHAAIISREFGLPCIVGTKVATRSIGDGDTIIVDADNGVMKIVKRAENK